MTLGILHRNFGRCPTCMRKAFVASLGAWACTLAGVALLGVSTPVFWLLLLAVSLTLLWATHVAAFARRALPALARTEAARAGEPADGSLASPTRRQAFAHVGRALALAAGASAFAFHAQAQSNCGCRVGDISCDPKTRVTYECQDVKGCTMWILKGTSC